MNTPGGEVVASRYPNITHGRIAISTIAMNAGTLFQAVSAVIVVRLVTDTLGRDGFGQYTIALSLVNICLLLTDLGISGVTTRDLARAPYRARELISDNLMLRIGLCLGVAPTIAATAFFVYPDQRASVGLATALLSLDIFFVASQHTVLTYYSSRVRNEITALFIVANRLLYLSGLILIVLVKGGLVAVVAAYLVADALCAAAAFVLVSRSLQLVVRVHLRAWRAILKSSLPLGFIQVITNVYLYVDSVLLSLYRPAAEVGLYGLAYNVVMVVLSFGSSLVASLVPSFARSSREGMQQIAGRALYMLMCVAFPIAIGGLLARHAILLLVASPRFGQAAIPLSILLLATPASFAVSLFSYAIFSVDRYRLLVVTSLGVLAANVVANVIVIPHFGVRGSATVVCISELLSAVATYALFRRAARASPDLSALWRPLVAASVMWPTWVVLTDLVGPPQSVVRALLYGSAIFMAYFLMLAAVRGIPTEVTGLLRRVLRRRP